MRSMVDRLVAVTLAALIASPALANPCADVRPIGDRVSVSIACAKAAAKCQRVTLPRCEVDRVADKRRAELAAMRSASLLKACDQHIDRLEDILNAQPRSVEVDAVIPWHRSPWLWFVAGVAIGGAGGYIVAGFSTR